MNILLYSRTIRHLKLAQIFSRLQFVCYHPRPKLGNLPRVGTVSLEWKESAKKNAYLIDPLRFFLFNQEYCLEKPEDWNNRTLEKLWLYHLHYFDDLNAYDARARRNWHETLIAAWIKANPPVGGIGWEPYPLSRRIVNWLKWGLAGNKLSESMISSLVVQVRYLCQRLEYHLLGNHLIANAKALVFAGLIFYGSEPEKWLNKGIKILSREIPRQILADGGHFELSPMYHSIVLEDLLDLYNLAMCYTTKFCKRWPRLISYWETTIQKMRAWLKVMCHPDGEIALFNDAAFGVAPSPSELEAYAVRLGLDRVSQPHKGLIHLKNSGYIRVQQDNAVAILDVGEIGPDYLPGHAHADTLTFELSIFGSRAIVNSGTSIYKKTELRQRQRSTAAHNTVVVDDMDSSEMWSAFRVGRRARVFGLQITDQGEQGIFIRCSHNGYTRLSGRVVHSRAWRFSKQELEVTDELEGTMSSSMARFHLHPDVKPVDTTPGQEEKTTFRIAEHLFWCSSSGGRSTLEDSFFYPRFGTSYPNYCLKIQIKHNNIIHSFSWK